MIDVVVQKRWKEAEDIVSFHLAAANGSPLPNFEAGAHIDLVLPNGMTRQYSLCNPGENQFYQITVLKDANSRGGSEFIHNHVQNGFQLRISEPRNLFALEKNAQRSLLIAGGIGITPLLAMSETLAHQQAEFELHYCTRSRTRTAFLEQLNASSYANRVHLYFDDEGTKFDIASLLSNPQKENQQKDTHIYVCGPSGFMDYVIQFANNAGWSNDKIHREYFSNDLETEEENKSFEIKIKSTGQVLLVESDERVIDVLENNGFYIPVSCEEGVCGTCLTPVLEGEPEHRDKFLTEEEHAANDQFTPCCSRSISSRLMLDL